MPALLSLAHGSRSRDGCRTNHIDGLRRRSYQHHAVPSDSTTTGVKPTMILRAMSLLLFDAGTRSIEVNCHYGLHCAAQPAELQPMVGILE